MKIQKKIHSDFHCAFKLLALKYIIIGRIFSFKSIDFGFYAKKKNKQNNEIGMRSIWIGLNVSDYFKDF